MTRLIKYINEDRAQFLDMSPREQSKLIKKDCKYYLNLTKNTGPFNRAIREMNFKKNVILKMNQYQHQVLAHLLVLLVHYIIFFLLVNLIIHGLKQKILIRII